MARLTIDLMKWDRYRQSNMEFSRPNEIKIKIKISPERLRCIFSFDRFMTVGRASFAL